MIPATIKRTTPWGDGYLTPGTPVPEDVPDSVVQVWLSNGKAEPVVEKPKPKGKAAD